MYYNSLGFIEEIKLLVENYGLTFREVSVGKNPVVPIKLWIEKARVDVILTAGHCTIRNGEGRSKSFDKSPNGWDQKILDYIKELLTAYKKLCRQ